MRWNYAQWTLFLGTRNRLTNIRENSFPGGCALSLSDIALTQYSDICFSTCPSYSVSLRIVVNELKAVERTLVVGATGLG